MDHAIALDATVFRRYTDCTNMAFIIAEIMGEVKEEMETAADLSWRAGSSSGGG